MSTVWSEIRDRRNTFREPIRWYNVVNKTSSVPGAEKDQNSFPCVLSDRYKDFIDLVLNYEVDSNDVWITTHPRSGTTWTQEMVWLLMNNLNYEEAKSIPLRIRSPTIRKL